MSYVFHPAAEAEHFESKESSRLFQGGGEIKFGVCVKNEL
jgi:hypothetical protein